MLYYRVSCVYPLKAFRKPGASKNTARDQSTPILFEMNSVEFGKGHGCSEKIYCTDDSPKVNPEAILNIALSMKDNCFKKSRYTQALLGLSTVNIVEAKDCSKKETVALVMSDVTFGSCSSQLI